ncbi:MAG: class I SAM-dependent methyltransferase, partial [Bacteroidia bacterium]
SGMDYGGGYGMFTRLMRDKGFDFYWHDDYCENLFANGFEADLKKKYDIITAFEVFEHLPNPQDIFKILIGNSKCFVFSTCLQDISKPEEFLKWWYRAEYSGQHISFFSKKALEMIAKSYNRNYYYIESQSIHIFSEFKMDQQQLLDIVDHKPGFAERVANKFSPNKIIPKKSLLTSDHDELLKKYLNKK